jgi:hypothetical protein
MRTHGLLFFVAPMLFLATAPMFATDNGEPQTRKDSKQNTLTVDAVLEEVDVPASRITASAFSCQVSPAAESVGGVVIHGPVPPHMKAKVKPTRFSNLLVLPDAKIRDAGKHISLKDLKAGGNPVRMELAVNPYGVVVVVAMERLPLERIGMEFTDALKAKNGSNRQDVPMKVK